MKLSDCCIKIGSGATPRGGKESYLKTGPFSLIRSQNVHNNIFLKSGLAFISEEQASQLQNVEVKSNDVLLNITGDSVARVCQVPDDVLPARVNQHVAIIRPEPTKLFHKYLHYFLVNSQMQSYMLSLASAGATRNALTKTMIENFELPNIHISEQKAIASVLSALDDKIENNNRMNKTLEEITHTIFKSWFIDFDPVHAKAAGNAPAHMDLKTAALFPSSFGGDGLPVGWQKVYLKDLTNIVYGKNLPTKKLLTSGYPVFGGNGVIGFFSEYLYDKPQVLVACRGAASGKVLRSLPFSFVTNNSLVIEITAPHLNRFFLELYLRDLTLEGFTTGSAQPQMTIANMDAVKLLNPTKEVLHRFQMVVEPLFDKVLANDTENQTLAELRDTLLPKLMSGEIRVKDAEREVEAAI